MMPESPGDLAIPIIQAGGMKQQHHWGTARIERPREIAEIGSCFSPLIEIFCSHGFVTHGWTFERVTPPLGPAFSLRGAVEMRLGLTPGNRACDYGDRSGSAAADPCR